MGDKLPSDDFMRAIIKDTFGKSWFQIRNTPVLLLTEEEIATLDPDGQAYARLAQANRARAAACPGHEAVSTGTRAESMRGWHPAKCKHCGIDMSVDSGD